MDYIINEPGSDVITPPDPSSLSEGDLLIFNNTSTGREGTILDWEVPSEGIYRITAYGARANEDVRSGFGAVISGKFELEEGQVIKLLVGQEGTSVSNYGSGGGGSFVVFEDDSPLIVAGGGGSSSTSSEYEKNGRSSTSGGLAYQAGSGGIGSRGVDGEGGTGDSDGRGGAGFYGVGDSLSESFIQGGVGGSSTNDGGFGCGGTNTNASGWHRNSAGGGYSGGAGARGGTWSCAGGGGSFISEVAFDPQTSDGQWEITGSEPDPVYSGSVESLGTYNEGHGQVIIEVLEISNSTISGYVTYQGLPVQGALVRAINAIDYSLSSQEVTDAQGFYLIDCKEEPYHVFVSYSGEHIDFIDTFSEGTLLNVEYNQGLRLVESQVSGYRDVPPIDLSEIKDYSSSLVTWEAETPEGTDVLIQVSLDGSVWNAQENNQPIYPFTIASYTDLTGMSLYFRQILTTENAEVTPVITSFEVSVKDQLAEEGTKAYVQPYIIPSNTS